MKQLSLDLQAAFPGETGFSSRNLWYMKKWYLFYSSELDRLSDDAKLQGKAFLHQAGAEFGNLSDNEQIPTIFTLVPWKHHVEIISKCESIEEAVFYIKLTVAESLSKQGLMNCMKANLFVTRGGTVANFKDKLQLRS